MAGLINQAQKRKPTLKRAGDADHDPADLATQAGAGVSSTGRLAHIPLEDLTPNPRNLRDNDAIADDPETMDLAKSMEVIGQQQPAVVVTKDAYLQRWPGDVDKIRTPWVVMIGVRRRAAALKNKRATLECIVREHVTPDLEQLDDLAFHENVHRQGLNPLRVAYYLADRKKVLGTEEAVAAKVGKTQPWVNQLLKLLKLTPELQELVQAGEINAAVGRDLAKLSHMNQVQVVDTAQSLSKTERERFWRTRGWTAAAPASTTTGPNVPQAPTPEVGDASPSPDQAVAVATPAATPAATATATAPAIQPEEPAGAEPSANPVGEAPADAPAAGGAQRPATIRVRIDEVKNTAADLRKHLDADQLAALVTELKRKRVGQAAGRTR
jgi:ParB family chromosome partitioning protein